MPEVSNDENKKVKEEGFFRTVLKSIKSFEKYANKFKLPINNKMNIKVKELRTVNLK